MDKHDPEQKRFLGLPHDLRRPTGDRIKNSMWRPGAGVFVPKAFGWGWTINLANPWSGVLLVGGGLAAVLITKFFN